MDPHFEPDKHQRLIATASRALTAMHAGEQSGSLDGLAEALRDPPSQQDEAKDLMLLLFHECSGMVSELGSGGTAPVKMQVYDDDGQEVSIDEADPPVRTAVRTLLAEVHGDQAAAKEQIEIALHNAAPEEMISVLVQALRWTIKLSAECSSRDLTVPDWIADALT